MNTSTKKSIFQKAEQDILYGSEARPKISYQEKFNGSLNNFLFLPDDLQ